MMLFKLCALISLISVSQHALAINGGQSISNSDSLKRSAVLVTWRYHRDIKQSKDGLEITHHANCAGTLISSNLVLTAAHCLSEGKNRGEAIPNDAEIWIYFQKSDGTVDESNGIKAIGRRHPKYHGYRLAESGQSDFNFRERDQAYDIALLKLEPTAQNLFGEDQPFKEDDGQMPSFAKPALLDLNSQLSLLRGETATSVGHQMVKTKAGKGFGMIGAKVQLSIANPNIEVSHLIRANGPVEGYTGIGPQDGDSGGPLYSNGSHVLVGILTRRAVTTSPPIAVTVWYEPVRLYMDWIKQAGKEMNADTGFR